MAGYTRQRRSSSFSILSIFKSCCSQGGGDDMTEEGMYARRICPSDEDGTRWIADPRIDRRASNFIDRFRKSVSESECQTFSV